jgi:3-hydroxyacyl-CoA dehydrogenase / 3-hydroxy-2-methylbutyryl-CoA dehydrogenase
MGMHDRLQVTSRLIIAVRKQEKRDIVGQVLFCVSPALGKAPFLGGRDITNERRTKVMELSGLVSLITGGASGLGEATAYAFLEAGSRVVLLDVNEETGVAAAARMGDRAVFVKTDVTDESSVKDAVDRAVDRFGAVHVAVNCAGVGFPAKVLGKEGIMPMSHFETVVRINLFGTMNVIRHAIAHMVNNEPNDDGEKGVVINTASVAAFEGQVGQAAYAASKAGVAGMTLPIAREFASYGVRVVTVAPGLFHTPMMASLPEHVQEALGKMVPFPKRLGKPNEFAALARHIVENRMLNGEVIRLDGAIRMQPR